MKSREELNLRDINKPQRIIVTGASGFVGQMLVPCLMGSNVELLLVGRAPEKLRVLFPHVPVCTYEELADRGSRFDMLVHLAARNNDQPGSRSAFRKVNVDFLCETARAAQKAGVHKFVDISSLQAKEIPEGQLAYVDSKREGSAALHAMEGLNVSTLFIPAIHGVGQYAGKLSILYALPRFLRPIFFSILGALKPTLHIDQLADHILRGAPEGIVTTGQAKNQSYAFLSRSLDICFALAVIVFFGWLLLLTWLAVRLDSSGPGVFIQSRVGRYGHEFPCYKLRTMRVDTPEKGTHEINEETSVTRVGHFLRASKVDELPQVLNLIRGDMSLIGPRPCLPVQRQLIDERIKHDVFSIRPGITGLAQVQKVDMSTPEKLARVDAAYLARRCIILDIKLAARTFLGGSKR